MLDCRLCYRLQRCGDTYYCAFAGQQPCIRGEIHTTRLVSPPPEKPTENTPTKYNVQTTPKKGKLVDNYREIVLDMVSRSIPYREIARQVHTSPNVVQRIVREAEGNGFVRPAPERLGIKGIPEFKPPSKVKNKHDWAKYHQFIFEKYLAGWPQSKIAKVINVSVSSLNTYIGRYRL